MNGLPSQKNCVAEERVGENPFSSEGERESCDIGEFCAVKFV